MSKFSSVPLEEDTRVLLEKESTLAGYPILYQKWIWDSIIAESIIFDSQDVEYLEPREIKALVKNSPYYNSNSNMTLSHSQAGFTFVNFNFSIDGE